MEHTYDSVRLELLQSLDQVIMECFQCTAVPSYEAQAIYFSKIYIILLIKPMVQRLEEN